MVGRAEERKIGSIIFGHLMILVFLAFVLAALAGYFVQNYFQERQSFILLCEYIEDFAADWDFNETMKKYITEGWGINNHTAEGNVDDYQDSALLKRLIDANTGWISEVSFVNAQGIVTFSSDFDRVGYDLHDSAYMSDFLCILDGEDYYARDFYPDPFETDKDLKIAYGAISLQGYDGLVLFGFDKKALKMQFEKELRNSVSDNRIEKTGYLITCNTDKIITGVTGIALNDRLRDNSPYTGEAELPDAENTITESITDFYGEKCYVSAVKKPGYYLIAAYPVKEANTFRQIYNVIFVTTLFIVLTALFLVLYFLLNGHVVCEVRSIHGSLKKITGGDLDEKADADGSLEFYELSRGINATVVNLRNRIREAKEQMAAEMEKARWIQESAVPRFFPENDIFGLYASMHTAEAVGGDFYDFFMTDENTLAIVIADVCGKGLPAALYMMQAKTLVKNFAEQHLPVDEVAEQVNLKLCEDAARKMFVTAWLGFLDLKTGILSYVHAGHTTPVHVGGEVSFVKQKINMVLGGIKKAKYIRQEIRLHPGESIYLYTDGVTEAFNAYNEMYGEKRLIGLMEESRNELIGLKGNALCKAGCEMVYKSVMEFVGDAPQIDDITMMWVTYR